VIGGSEDMLIVYGRFKPAEALGQSGNWIQINRKKEGG
jgi:hypothetical protein